MNTVGRRNISSTSDYKKCVHNIFNQTSKDCKKCELNISIYSVF